VIELFAVDTVPWTIKSPFNKVVPSTCKSPNKVEIPVTFNEVASTDPPVKLADISPFTLRLTHVFATNSDVPVKANLASVTSPFFILTLVTAFTSILAAFIAPSKILSV